MTAPTRNRAVLWFVLLYAVGIAYLSLYPFHFAPRPGYPLFFWVALEGRRQIFDFIVNVLFYMPLGAALLAAFGGRFRALPAAIFCGTLWSLGIESAQYWEPRRYSTLSDLVANGLGTAVGTAVAVILCKPRVSAAIGRILRTERWRLSAAQGLFLTGWVLWQGFPFFPLFSLPRLHAALEILRHPTWDALVMVEAAIGTAILVLALGSTLWIWVALAILPLQVLLLDRQISPQVILAASIAWVLTTKLRRSISPTCLAVGLIAWLMVEEFRPFHLNALSQQFAWMPFQSAYSNNTTDFYSTIFRKLYLYTATVWSIHRAGVARAKSVGQLRSDTKLWTLAITIPAVILSVGEWAQQYLEGRTPESTDLILLAAGAAGLMVASKPGPKSETDLDREV